MVRSALQCIERLFVPLILCALLLGLLVPQWFIWVKPYTALLLGWIIFGIGMTIRNAHIQALLARPWLGLFAIGKFTLMPCIAYGLGLLLQLSPEFLLGMVILGACPGGTAANVMSYLARADTALTVLLTILTTLFAPLATPLIIYAFFHHVIALDIGAMMEKLFWVIVFPLFDVLIIRHFFARPAQRIEWMFPPLSMLAIALLIAFIAAANRIVLLEHPWLVMLAVLAFNLGGYAAGYGLSRLFRCSPDTSQSVAFEYGVQDTALGIIIATHFFTPIAALPCALCSVLQNLTGPMLAKRLARQKNAAHNTNESRVAQWEA